MTQLQDILAQRILVLDGAMGTMIQSYGLEEEDFRNKSLAHLPGQLKGNNDLLNLTRPDVVEDIARRYLTAGADILTTNTFSSQRISMADYHCEEFVRQLNVEGAKIARRVADEFMRQYTPSLCGGWGRADQPHGLHQRRCQRSGSSCGDLHGSGHGLWRAN